MDRRRDKLASSVAIPSPVLALLLAACGGGGGGGGFRSSEPTVSGFVFDGPVSDAIVFIDVNNNGRFDSGDVRIATTASDGSYSRDIDDIPEEHRGKALSVDLTGATDVGIDPNSTMDDRSTSGVWRAPVGSTIISPLTELMVATGQSEAQIASALGLSGIRITTHNPFDGSNRTKNDILVIAAGVAVAEDLKVTRPDYATILEDVGESIGALSRAYDTVSASGFTGAEFGELRTALMTVYGAGLRNSSNDNIANDLADGILYHLSSAVAVAADISATLAGTSGSVGELADSTEKLVDIDVEKPSIFGLELNFVITGTGSEIFEVRGNDDNWGLYLKEGQTLDFETTAAYTLSIELQVLDGEREVHSIPVTSNYTLNVTNEDEADASIYIFYTEEGGRSGVSDVLVAVVTSDLDAINGDYPIVWSRDGEPNLGTGATYTLQEGDFGNTISATTTYNDPGKGGAPVTVASNDGIYGNPHGDNAIIHITPHPIVPVENLVAGDELIAVVTPDINDVGRSWNYAITWVTDGVPELGRDLETRQQLNGEFASFYDLKEDDIGKTIYAVLSYENPSNPGTELYNFTQITPGRAAQEQAVGGSAGEASSFGELDSNNGDDATLPDII